MIEIEFIGNFEHDDEAPYPDYFAFYRVWGYGNRIVTTGVNYMDEDSCISYCSHECIEALLSVIEMVHNGSTYYKHYKKSKWVSFNIHNIIGQFPSEDGQLGDFGLLTEEDYANNTDGLPNLPKSLYIEKDIEVVE